MALVQRLRVVGSRSGTESLAKAPADVQSRRENLFGKTRIPALGQAGAPELVLVMLIMTAVFECVLTQYLLVELASLWVPFLDSSANVLLFSVMRSAHPISVSANACWTEVTYDRIWRLACSTEQKQLYCGCGKIPPKRPALKAVKTIIKRRFTNHLHRSPPVKNSQTKGKTCRQTY